MTDPLPSPTAPNGSHGRASGSSLASNQSLIRGADILRALARRPEGMTIAEITRTVDLPRTTVARLLATLADIGFADRTPTVWVVGRELTRIGRTADPLRRVIDVSRPVLEELALVAEVSAVVQIVRDNWEAEVIVQVDPPKLVGPTNWLERRFAGELHASAAGKLALSELSDDQVILRFPRPLAAYTPVTIKTLDALLAELANIRRQGFAETVDELEVGLTANAVPLHIAGVAEAAGVRSISIGLSGVTSRLLEERRVALLPAILAARDRIAAEVEGHDQR
jgi:IclR family transcriptional regulator, acetate operon repressor